MVQDIRLSLVVFWLWSASKKKKRRQHVDFFYFYKLNGEIKIFIFRVERKIEIFGRKQEI